jgi:uncharacterized protein YgbK (DUF1537 family)
MAKLLLGCIADDFTGATDLANNLVRAGMRVVQAIGVPDGPLDAEVDAVVVALKSRTIAPAEAVAQSLDALRWLQAQGARQIYFKYCSTFDSTFTGEARQHRPRHRGADGRAALRLHHRHPRLPRQQAHRVQGLPVRGRRAAQRERHAEPPAHAHDRPEPRARAAGAVQRKVGLIDYTVVARGAQAIEERIAQLKAEGVSIAVVDAVSNDDLLRMGPALKKMPLLTAGSGVAIGLPANFGLAPSSQASALPKAGGKKAVVSGSCSLATNRQVQDFVQRGGAAMAIDPLRIASGADVVAEVLSWATPLIDKGPVLVYSTAEAGAVKSVQGRLGVEEAGAMVERTIASIARGLVERGVHQLVVAGGETSGACVQALGIAQMQIGPQIDPGVPWCHARSDAAPEVGVAHCLEVRQLRERRFFYQGVCGA